MRRRQKYQMQRELDKNKENVKVEVVMSTKKEDFICSCGRKFKLNMHYMNHKRACK